MLVADPLDERLNPLGALAIYTGLQLPGAEAQVARLAVISILLSIAALIVSELLVRRSGEGRAHVL